MATARKKKTTKSTSAKNARTKRAVTKKVSLWKSLKSSRVFLVCCMTIACVFALISLFRLGSAGRLLYGMLSLVFGTFSIPMLLSVIAFCFWYIWTGAAKKVNPRIWTGLFFGMLGWCSLAALPSIPDKDPWLALALINANAASIITGSASTYCGYLGALLAGGLCKLFSIWGAWIFVLAFLALAVVLLGWVGLKAWLISLHHTSAASIENRRLKKAEKKQSDKLLHQQNQPANEQEPAAFNFDINSDGNKKKEQKILQEAAFSQESFSIFKADSILDSVKKQPQKSSQNKTDENKKAKASKASSKRKGEGASGPKEESSFSRQDFLPKLRSEQYANYQLPKISVLNEPVRNAQDGINEKQAYADGQKLIDILQEFGVPARLSEIHIGPSVTKFEITPGTGIRVNTITNLQNDIKMALAATDIRIEAPIPGKSAVGIEVPNVRKSEVSMRSLMGSIPSKLAKLPLVFALGKDLLGNNVYGRLDSMPHLLIAGATGSGKSVCVNSIICSILMRTRPDEVKLILVDPKKVEFSPYNGVPHLLAPVITDGDLANKALKVVVEMMDRRYDLFEEAGVRNITAYNAYVDQNPDTHFARMGRIVVIIDELADLMLVAAKEVEQSIQRITQLARAAGIHLIVATQRPSVNVITGVIKANIPARIAFAVSSSVDSRTILDQAGAEKLLGHGDMLFLDNGDTACRRIQGVFIKDEEVNRIAEYVKEQASPVYDDAFITLKDLQSQGNSVNMDNEDPLYEEVRNFVIQAGKCSTSLIQRRFAIGYSRAARLVDALEINGIIGPSNGSKPREILVSLNYEDVE